MLASMREWKHGQRPQPAPAPQPAALRLSPAQSTGSPHKGKRTDAPAPAAAAQPLDDTVDGFVYEVEMVFTRAGRLGLEFGDDDGATVVTKIHSGGLAAAMPLACKGLVVSRVRIDRQAPQSTEGMGYEGVLALLTTRERPLSITFAHCWQRQTDGGRPYYSNSATGESVWERPPVLEAVLAAMQERQPQPKAQLASPKTPVVPSTADIESLPGFRYELRMYEVKTEFEKSGLLGFKYRENAEGDKVVYKIARMTPAASLENGKLARYMYTCHLSCIILKTGGIDC